MGNKKKFDPDGSGYDEETAQEYIDKWPVKRSKPTKYEGDYVFDEDGESFQAWVWHPELGDYKKHSGSLDPKTGMVLKGRNHPTWDLMEEEEKRRGNMIIQKPDGRYYSVPKRLKFPTMGD